MPLAPQIPTAYATRRWVPHVFALQRGLAKSHLVKDSTLSSKAIHHLTASGSVSPRRHLNVSRQMQSYVAWNLTGHALLRATFRSFRPDLGRAAFFVKIKSASSAHPTGKRFCGKFEVSRKKLAENVRRPVSLHDHLRPAGVCAGIAMADNPFLPLAPPKRILIPHIPSKYLLGKQFLCFARPYFLDLHKNYII